MDEDAVIFQTGDVVQCLDSGTLKRSYSRNTVSELNTITYLWVLFLPSVIESFSESSSSEESESSSDMDSSDSFSSGSFEDSSYSDLSPEDEGMEEDGEDDRSGECIVISSDEESMELEPPVTPSAPLTPGAQLELGLQDWSDPFHREETEDNQYSCCQQDTCGLDATMELQTIEPQDHLLPLSPIGLPGYIPSMLWNSRRK